MKKPNKKTLLLLLVAIIAVTVTAYLIFYKSNKEVYMASVTAVPNGESSILAKDSDGDGLKDWEEQLWKTDPRNPDSDGDGTPDGVEIKNGRNPTVAGPNDKLDTETVVNKINTETESDLTETDKFSRDLFLKVVSAKEANAPPTQEDLANYMSTTIAEELKKQKLKNFTESDFSVNAEENPEIVKEYGEKIAEVMKKKPPQKLEYELAVFDRAQKNNDTKELEKLAPLIAQYQYIENSLLKMTVPKSALPKHISFTNGVAGMIYSITGLKYIMTDPIKALPGVDSYDENFGAFINGLRQLRDSFQAADVVFERGDYGYNFFDKIP